MPKKTYEEIFKFYIFKKSTAIRAHKKSLDKKL